ncbi:MAG: pseudouridine synthase, partial [Anaerolineales bacterium]|nr:pseudouridine synthase [Anaerolineales bacterium]
DKTYLALLDRQPPSPTGRVEVEIGRDPSHRQKMAVVPRGHGRPAVSEYKTIENFKRHTYAEVHPVTGRQHQIRLHMAFLGCPVAADTLYGYKEPSVPLDRHFLHAARIKFRLPGAERRSEFEAGLPPDLEQVLKILRGER